MSSSRSARTTPHTRTVLYRRRRRYLTLKRYSLTGTGAGFTLMITADQAEATVQEAAENESGV